MSLFVTGTDTGCGKTRVSCALLRALAIEGIPATGMKPVATGAIHVDGRLVNDDVEALRAASGMRVPLEDMNPYTFEPPCSPHIAARAAATQIDLDRILRAYANCRERADVVVVEGVGGWRVPLGDELWLENLVEALDLPVLLVVGVKLGCINHAVLTAEAINSAKRPLLGWVANILEPSLFAMEHIIQTLTTHLPAPRFAVIDWTADANPNALAPSLSALAHELGSRPPQLEQGN